MLQMLFLGTIVLIKKKVMIFTFLRDNQSNISSILRYYFIRCSKIDSTPMHYSIYIIRPYTSHTP